MEIRPGDIVKISKNIGWHWADDMNHWRGKIVTIKKISLARDLPISIYDDNEEHSGLGWGWKYSDFIQASNVEISTYLAEKKRKLCKC